MRSWHNVAVLLLANLSVMLCVSLAQSAQMGASPLGANSAADTYAVDGTVLNAVTGEPIRAALVQGPTGARLTGSDGKFLFEKVPPAQYVFSARKPGFFSEQDLAQGVTRATLTPVGPNMAPVVLKLTPEGVIYGRITGADGEPIENFAVRVMVSRVVNGRKHWEQQGGQPTDDEGQFRIAELRPGTYYVKAGPGMQPLPRLANSQMQPEGYPGTFYPGARDLETATPIQVEPGRQYRAEFSMQPVPMYKVAGVVTGVPLGPNGNSMGAAIQLFSSDGDVATAGVRFNPQAGTFNMDAVPAGMYTLVVSSQDPVNRRQLTARIPLTVTGDVAGVRLVLGPSPTIPVNVRTEPTRADSQQQNRMTVTFDGPNGTRTAELAAPPVNVMLESMGPGLMNRGSYASLEGQPGNQTFGLRNVQPGTYRVEITPTGSWYVQSAHCGSVDLLREELQVAIGGSVEPIEVALRDDIASLRGSVSTNGQPVQATVLVVPAEAPRLAKLVLSQQDGSFYVGGLAPGDYRVLALDSADDLEYAEPEGLRDFSASMQSVRLSPNQQGIVTVELVRRRK